MKVKYLMNSLYIDTQFRKKLFIKAYIKKFMRD